MQNLLLLHGAIGAADQLQPLADSLAEHYTIHTLNFSGHGGTDFTNNFSIENFAQEVLTFLAENNFATISIFGYSMGGYVGAWLAKYHPEKIDQLMTLGTKWHWSPEVAQKEVKMLNADVISQKLPDFAAALQTRHQPNDWREVLSRTATMLLNMGNQPPLSVDDFPNLSQSIRVMLGDRDRMVTLAETVEVYQRLTKGSLAVLPQTPHPIEQVNVERLVYEIRAFFV